MRDPALMLPTIAQALGLLAQSNQPAAEVLAAHLRERQFLLVLDNCEQVAEAALPTFALTPSNVAAVAAIRVRLDGLPLAIELAAARVAAFLPTALVARLDRSLDVLVEGPRDAPARQQTLRNTLAWSYDLLPPTGQALFRRLAPCASGCTMGAALAMCRGDASDDADVAEGLATLVGAHLLGMDAGAGEPRYAMLATVREYALERLETAGEGEAAT